MSSDDSSTTNSRKGAAPQRPRKKARQPPIAINFKKGEEDDQEEFFRQLRKYTDENDLAKPNKSDFAKHLLLQSLYSEDRVHAPTIQALLADLKEATAELSTRLAALENQNKKLGNTLAEGVGMLLVSTKEFTPDQVKDWLDQRLGIKRRG